MTNINKIIKDLELHKFEYLKYRGSSFSLTGELFWAKDDAVAYAEGIDYAITMIKGEGIKCVVCKKEGASQAIVSGIYCVECYTREVFNK